MLILFLLINSDQFSWLFITLIELDGNISEDCLSGFVFSDSSGATLTAGWDVNVCDDIDNDDICDDVDDCVGAYDDCGVCAGDGSSCLASLSLGAFDSAGTLEVLYDFGSDVGCFQFDISGLALEGAVGGVSGDAGLTVSFGSGTGNGDFSTVIGFSLTGDTIPAGSGVLTVLNFSDVTSSMTELAGAVVAGADGSTLDVTSSGSIDSC